LAFAGLWQAEQLRSSTGRIVWEKSREASWAIASEAQATNRIRMSL
jgi:hypothetical protein